ncbi:hypothetical protein LY90DRAFT_513455 [Neocallimastix californiae]|jgi:hypothetical protein|uniref:L domain-like protein n=1 Tax=Neocallimastix californiae TaxID=1754190 RepID=A0A1Y2AYN6_9FUNG|nr:hypothetical protein LY90DRAFT_513455 [Neocallimastix californiae]|eukprot:ORY27410.1 hypothetical protein LY90DRAFT_513455 [Neocallimastix californiae]
MKMQLLKKNLLSTVVAVLLLGSRVKATSDCEYLEKAIKYFNEDLRKVFKVDKCCDFNGIRCDADKNIHEIKFNNVNKTRDINSFIDKISNLKNLTYLDLAHNNIEGSFPKAVCSIKTLKNLNLSKNKLKGTIPFECKNLENLEQINFEGNKDLTGYVPYLSNIRGCAFKETGLCDVPNALCKNSPKNCTEADYVSTNAKNGNPDSKSKTYEGADIKNRDFSLYDNYNGYSYGYSGYDDYNNYGNYDVNNYYGNSGYGYGYGDWSYYGNNYDPSYYNNGYYGTGYDNGYYYNTGYDTSYYDNGYYDNGYSQGYTGTTNAPSNTHSGTSSYAAHTYSAAPRTMEASSKLLISVVAVVFGIVLGNL